MFINCSSITGGSSARLVDVGTQLCGTHRAVRIVNKKKSFINGGPCETPAVTSFHTKIWSILFAYLLIWITILFFAVRRQSSLVYIGILQSPVLLVKLQKSLRDQQWSMTIIMFSEKIFFEEQTRFTYFCAHAWPIQKNLRCAMMKTKIHFVKANIHTFGQHIWLSQRG